MRAGNSAWLFVALGAAIASLQSCNTLDDQITHDESVRSQAQAIAARDVDNADRDERAKAMEADLALKQRFYQGVSGRYAGESSTAAGHWQFEAEIAASVPPYHSTRIRTEEEITADLNNLQLSIRITQRDPATGAEAACTFTEVRPNVETGRAELLSELCPAAYSLKLLPQTNGSAQGPGNGLDVQMNSSRISGVLEFRMERVESFAW